MIKFHGFEGGGVNYCLLTLVYPYILNNTIIHIHQLKYHVLIQVKEEVKNVKADIYAENFWWRDFRFHLFWHEV